ncbi:hypothetical protein LPY66_19625 [Dehalobacter sp. DCM]|uniref:hypothetical protein n=1 Tax=Dehalobacter sp. DCM TaxID=2907827 RepID=UPI003081279D|nr:hypothetical protein LPY66_19625 [Dehalobacter sp. DCM]
MESAKEAGLKLSSGFLLSFGLSEQAFVEGLKYLKSIDADWIAIQPFVPYPYTDLQNENPTNPYQWARAMAVTRLYTDERTNLVATENAGVYANFLSLTGANGFFIFPNQQR